MVKRICFIALIDCHVLRAGYLLKVSQTKIG